jgi:hypothetical protein
MSALRILFDRAVPVSGCEARESITVAGLRAVWPQVVRPAHGSDVVLSPARCLLRRQPRNLFKEAGEYIVPAMIARWRRRSARLTELRLKLDAS